jgi:hypothetical protein
MVVIADKVQKAVNYHAVQLVRELGGIEYSVLTDGIDADEKVARKDLSFAIIKGDYIGEIVVLEILHVHVEDIIVGTENDVHVPQLLHLAARHGLQPFAGQHLIFEIKFNIFGEESDHSTIFVQIYNIKRKNWN